MSDGNITKTAATAELQSRTEALIAENSEPLPDEAEGDARLVEAARRFFISIERRRALDDEFEPVVGIAVDEATELVWPTESALHDVVSQATPRSFAGALAKLRLILWKEDLEDDPEIEQIIALLEARDGAAVTDGVTAEADRDPFALGGHADAEAQR